MLPFVSVCWLKHTEPMKSIKKQALPTKPAKLHWLLQLSAILINDGPQHDND